ncbi:CDP-glucose 4,6-dehydratase [Saezia sanguinis]|uniref:CDP-glucose 4,6-dehydratase n=1 Tax=Saezia sanguinis TaxID=1965230 RepID=A0A433SB98_9BURK|nr:CDP-glucose 4,6-dehydratase [Saezia sanguinis]RUS65969.1 CDP-glucose 4,6-dehydratase [Saezia sanguinis]
MFNNVYQGKTILVTGHTGFKGSWLSIWLTMMGAKVIGYSLDPYSQKGNFVASHLSEKLFADIRGDIRDYEKLNGVIEKYQPEFIFHLAAQALVKTAYANPKETYETNLMGSLNMLEVTRQNACVKTVVMITSDKCYENVEQIWGYKETDRMGGYDPYSSSKGCAELMISSYRNSYFNPQKYAEHGKAIASVRAGNVIGGGDWSDNRLIPDCIRFIEAGKDIEIRNPKATRPWEHVLEPLSGYLRVGEKLLADPIQYATSFNFGPHISANKTVMEVVSKLAEYYGKGKVIDASSTAVVHENTLLNLDVTKAYVMLGWHTQWNLKESIEKTVDWYKKALTSNDMYDFCVEQIEEYIKRMEASAPHL